MFLKFLYFTCCLHPFSFRTSLFILGLMFHYIHNFISKIKKKKHAHFKISSRDEVFRLLFFIPIFLTEMSSSWNEISSRQERVNSKRHFTMDRDDFVPGRVSFRDEISRVNTFSL